MSIPDLTLKRRTLFLSFLAYFPDEIIPLMLVENLGKIVWGASRPQTGKRFFDGRFHGLHRRGT